ncbi:MAG TPA: hypothetical protein VGK77_24890 [Candidatus Binatia bacterium]
MQYINDLISVWTPLEIAFPPVKPDTNFNFLPKLIKRRRKTLAQQVNHRDFLQGISGNSENAHVSPNVSGYRHAPIVRASV